MVKRTFLAFACGLAAVWNVSAQLSLADVEEVISQAVTRATVLGGKLGTNAVVAVTDREGWVLGVWTLNTNGPASADVVANAITKAGTAAFLSSDNNAFTTRTAGFIVQQHFPPGIRNRPPGPLVGVNFSNLSFSDINKLKGPGSVITFDSTPGFSIVPVPTPITGGLAGTPGGVPLYQAGRLVGGVGVAGDGDTATDITPKTIAKPDRDEDAAMAGQAGFAPSKTILATHVFIDGIRLPYVSRVGEPGIAIPFASLPGVNVAPYTLQAAPAAFAYPVVTLGGKAGQLRQPIADDPLLFDADPNNNTINGAARLTATEVTNIVAAAAKRARTTRAGIRLPRSRAAEVFIAIVNNPDSNGVSPAVLGTFCTSSNATRFSWDVAVQKARTALFFSSSNRAYSSRTVGFLAQSLYPPGIQKTQPGPYFGLQEQLSIITPLSIVATNPVNGAVFSTSTSVDPDLPNGITIFPGGFPLYRDGVLIGAIGVSGDGIDQDDLIAAAGAALFPAPKAIRADRTRFRGARLPYAKFPRNPAL